QIHIVHNDRVTEPIDAVHILIVDGRLDHVTPRSEVTLELRTDQMRAVVERESIQRIAYDILDTARMRVRSFANAHALAPVQKARIQKRRMEGGTKIET